MKREEIEQLLAEYVKGEISVENKRILENQFTNDPALKQQADEMLALWQMMDNTVVDENNDEQFYNMLQAEKQNARTTNIISLNKAWFYATAAAACIIIFFAGRFTTAPVEVIKHKTLIVKQQVPGPVQQQIVQVAQLSATPKLSVSAKPKVQVEIEVPSALAQQLRSVYASERIDAITKLTSQQTLSKSDLELLKMALREDPNTNVRLMILNTLKPLSTNKSVQDILISALNHQDNTLVQTSIVDLLVAVKSKQAIPQMIVLLDDKNTDFMVQNKIKAGIESYLY